MTLAANMCNVIGILQGKVKEFLIPRGHVNALCRASLLATFNLKVTQNGFNFNSFKLSEGKIEGPEG